MLPTQRRQAILAELRQAKAVSADAGPQPHDATWKVSIGETITMLPQNIDAANIAKSHDACKK